MKKTKFNDKVLNIRLPTYIYNDLKLLCYQRNINVSLLIRNLISMEVVKNGKNK